MNENGKRRASRGTRETLVETAARLFAEHGYDGVSVRDITRAAGANLGAVTYHFGGKEGLFGEVMSRKIEPLRHMGEEIVSGPEPPDRKLAAMLNAYGMHVMHDDPDLKVLFAEMLSGGARLPPAATEAVEWRNRIFERVVRDGIRRGIFRACDVECAAWCFFDLLCAYILYVPLMGKGGRRGPYPKAFVTRVVRAALDIFLNGLRTREKPRRRSAATAAASLALLLAGAWSAPAESSPPAGSNAPPAAAAHAPASYTLEDCVRLGLERSGRAENARRDQQIAAATVVQARSTALPHLSLGADYRRQDEVQTLTFGDDTLELGKLDNYSGRAQIDQLLYSGGKVRAALRAARLSEDYAQWQRADVEQALIRDIRSGFYDVLLAESTVSVSSGSVSQLKGLLNQTEQKFRNGTASEFDLLSAKVALGNEEPKLIRARNSCDVAVEDFRRLVNLPAGAFRLDGKLSYQPVDVTLDGLDRLAMQNRPALRVQEAIVGLRRQDIVAAGSENLPALNALASYQGFNPRQLDVTSQGWDWHWSAGAALTWNLWDGGLTRGTVRQKRLEWEKSETDLDELRKSVRLEVKQAYLLMENARRAVEAARGSVELAERALAIAKTRFDTGLSTYLEFTDGNLALNTAQLIWLQALRSHLDALIRLRYACGLPHEDLKGKANP